MINKLLEKRRAQKHEKRMTVICDECGEKVNVERQTMLCPHETIEEFTAGSRINKEKS